MSPSAVFQILMASRILFSLARDGSLPRWLIRSTMADSVIDTFVTRAREALEARPQESAESGSPS